MKTRVMLIINHLADGGAERTVSLWSKILADANCDVTVLTYYPRPDEYPLDSRVTRISLISNIQEYSKLTNKAATRKKLLQTYLTQHPQDILIPFLSECNLVSALIESENLKVITQTIRDSPWDKEQGLKLAFRDWAIKSRGSVILQNDEQLKYFDTPSFKHVKKYIVHNALNPDIFNLKKDNYRQIKKIVAVGRLVTQKNHALMIEAIRILRDEYHENYYLDIYGVGELESELQSEIDKAKLGNQIKLCGRKSNIFNIIINYDLFLMTSLREGTPNALLEAMGLGLPSLAIKCRTGITELINDGKNGYIVNSYDPHILAEKIHSINNQAQLEKIGKQARVDMFSRYTPEIIKKELLFMINDLLTNPPHFFSVSLEDTLKPSQLQTQTDFQSYFEFTLHLIKISNYELSKQVFDYARNVLKEAIFDTPNAFAKLYSICLRRNQFDVFYDFVRITIDKTSL